MNSLLINLSFLIPEPTGLATYATNLFPHLQALNPTLLVGQPIASYTCYPVPPNLTAAQGRRGHMARLMWTQLELPKIYRQLSSRLLFSPIPEAPVMSSCRYVVTVHDLIPLRFPRWLSPLTPYHRYYLPKVLAGAEHIICDSVATAQDVTDFLHIPASKVTPVLLAHDASHFRCLDLPRGNYFLYIGRHDPYKNLYRVIEAFAALPNRSDFELWVAGTADRRYTPHLMAQAEELGVGSLVKFPGYVPYEKLPVLLNQAIALVFPSLWEGFGLPVLEAMACGTPVIASNRSSLPEVAGDAAILVDPYSVGEITEAMQAVASSAGLRCRLLEQGLGRASRFSWAKTGQKTAEILQRYL